MPLTGLDMFSLSSLKLVCVRVSISENCQCRQRILYSRRNAAVRQIQVAEILHESVRHIPDLFGGRFQSVATQVLPAQQLDGVRLVEVASAVRSLQQSAVQ